MTIQENNQVQTAPTEERWMKPCEVAKFFQCSKNTLYALRKSEGFPKARYFGEHSPRWKLSELQAWMDSRDTAPAI